MNRMLWICSLLAVLLHLGPSPARAQVPAFMPLQGFLTDTAGAPITGATDVTVSFYSVDVAGASLHTESQTVEVQDGYFTLYVGDVTPLDATLFRDQRTLFVGLQLPGEAEMTPRFQLGTVPYAGFAAFAGAVSFDDVTDIPAGLLDGDDVGPTYGAGEGITITGTSIAVDRATTQARVSGACAAGSAIRAIEPDGTVTCETDDVGAAGTTYVPGLGLTLTGSTFAVDPAAVQTRIGGSCPVGQSIRAITAGGSVTCEVDDDLDTTYGAGPGLRLVGTTFAADTGVLQSRVAGVCGSGQAITAIGADGSVTCIATGTLYAAGVGLRLVGTTFEADLAYVQRRVTGSCPGGSITAIGADGTVTCAAAICAGTASTLCGLSCVDTTTDEAHCGGCGISCPAGHTCSGGACSPPVVEVVTGTEHTCARRSDGRVYCWGQNVRGELGDGRTGGIQTRPTLVAGLTDAVQLAAGSQYTCALRSGGQVACWGWNDGGALGDGSTIDRLTPTMVSGLTDAVEIDAMYRHTCARRRTGQVVCWGNGGLGRLGNGLTANRTTPTLVTGITDAVEVSTGVFHTCVRRAAGGLACWGYNEFGQLGDGSNTDRLAPVDVPGVAGASQVSAGGNHTCARFSTGTVLCWGTGGVLGDGSSTMRMTPTPVVDLTDAVDLSAGPNDTCARRSGGSWTCWGTNLHGEHGNGTTYRSMSPLELPGSADFTLLRLGGRHACARTAGSGLVCWGDNGVGQLGAGTSENRYFATPVIGL